MNQMVANEEMALRLVNLYFKEIARLGFKRKLDLDSIMNAYLYTLNRIEDKSYRAEIKKLIVIEEQKLRNARSKEDLFPVIPSQ